MDDRTFKTVVIVATLIAVTIVAVFKENPEALIAAITAAATSLWTAAHVNRVTTDNKKADEAIQAKVETISQKTDEAIQAQVETIAQKTDALQQVRDAAK